MLRFRQAVVAVLLVFAVGVSAPVHASGILDSALRHAAQVQLGQVGQSPLCSAAFAAGSMDGLQRQGAVGWALAGLVFPIITPIVAHTSTPQPPVATVLQYSPDDARCYSAGYSAEAASKRQRGAWIGTGVSLGLSAVVYALTRDNGTCYGYHC